MTTLSHASSRKPAVDAARITRRQPLVPQAAPIHVVLRTNAACACGGGCPRCRGQRMIQPKLKLSQPGDAAEHEADRIADTILRMPDSEGATMVGSISTSSLTPGDAEPVPRGGAPLDQTARGFMEPRFGSDLSQVHVHTDLAAAQSAAALRARAYTVGNHIVFGAQEYSAHSPAGRRLLAHELTHVMQQQAGVHLRDGSGELGDPHERHADGASHAVVDPLQRQVKIQRQTLPAEQPTELPAAAEPTQSGPGETTTDKSPLSDPLVIEAAVGVKGDNRVDDVAKVQARLLAVGLLSEADFAAESPRPAATASASPSGTEATDTGIVGSTPPDTATTTPGDSLDSTMPVPGPSAETITTSTAVAGGATPTTIPEASLTATIAAIREFQQSLFSKEVVDANIGPAGPTWRALSTTDAATVAKLKEAWGKKKQQMEAESARKLKAEAERKKLEAWEQSKEAEQQRTTIANTLLVRYATYIPNTSTYINLDESGLAGALTDYAKTDGKVVLNVFDGLDVSDTDDVAYEMACNATDEELAKFDARVLAYLKNAMTGWWQSDEETKQIARIDGVLDVQPKAPGGSGLTTHAVMLEDPATGKLESPTIDAKTLEERVKQIHIAYDEYFVERAQAGNCFKATKAALAKMGWEVGSSDQNFIPGEIGDAGLTDAQNKALLAALLAEVQAGNPVAIGVNYQPGNPGNVDKITDHWLYIVASIVDDNGQPVLVAYENADVSSSKITDGNIVLFRIDEMGRLYHGAYFPGSEKKFSTESHVVVNFRPTKRMPKP